MQEKDIKQKLNQELEEMAPDILNKILAKPIEPIKSEKELMGKDKPLFKEKKKISKYIFAPAITAMAACLIFVIFLFEPFSPQENAMAFSIVIDVNPSITIEVDEEGNVEKLVAGNKDAKKIVRNVNKKIEEDDSYNKVLRKVLKQLNKEGYLKKKDKVMLLSVVADDEIIGQEKVAEVKEKTNAYTEKKNIKCKPVYQSCVVTEEVKKVAKKNNVSVGKAAFCIKIAKKEKVNVDKICKESVDNLVEYAEKSGITVNNIVVEETTYYIETSKEITSENVETSTEETNTTVIESELETTTVNESESIDLETTSEQESVITSEYITDSNVETSIYETTVDTSTTLPEQSAETVAPSF